MSYYYIVVPTGPINIIHDIFDDNDNVNIEPLNMTVNNRTRFSYISFMAYKCLPVIILLLMIVIGILSGFIGMYTNQIQRLKNEVKTRDDDMLQMQKKINVTRRLNEIYKERESRHDNRISALKFLISEYENNNTKLNKQLVELEENESKIYI